MIFLCENMILININIKTIFFTIYFSYLFSYVARADKYTLYRPISTSSTSDGVLVQSAGPASIEASVLMPPCDLKKRPSQRLKAVSPATSATDETTPCCGCAMCYDEPSVDSWTQCPQCHRWFHDSCGSGDTTLCYFCLG